MSEHSPEANMIRTFGLTYFALKASIHEGNVSKADTLAMVDIMAAVFRDYVEYQVKHRHTFEEAAVEASNLISKVKGL